MILNAFPYGSADYALLQTINAGAGTANLSIDLSGYAGYTGFIIYLDSTLALPGIVARFNNDSGNRYYQNEGYYDRIRLAGGTTNSPCGVLEVFNAISSETAIAKTYRVATALWNEGYYMAAGRYSPSPNVPITSVQFYSDGVTNMSQNLKLRIYGVK